MKILIPLDGSEYAEHALTRVMNQAERSEGTVEIHLLMVANAQTVQSRWQEAWRVQVHSIFGASGGCYSVPPGTEEQTEDRMLRVAECYLEEIAHRFSPHQVKKTVVIGDDPAGEIIAYARREDVNQITLATSGREAMARLLLGSGVATVVIVSPKRSRAEDTAASVDLEVRAEPGVQKQAV
jgi:nucleotide-binding universal stress UspA family protein